MFLDRDRPVRKSAHGQATVARRFDPRLRSLTKRVALAPVIDAKVDELRAFVREHGDRWLTEADEPLIKLAARNLVVLDQIWSYMVQRQAMDSAGRARAVMDFWARLNNVSNRQLTALGLGPVARAELGANVAGAKRDLAAAMAGQHRRQQLGNGDGLADSPSTVPK